MDDDRSPSPEESSSPVSREETPHPAFLLCPSPLVASTPPEVVLEIVRYTTCPSSLWASCLVSRDLYLVAARLLYEHVVLDEPGHVMPFLERLRLARASSLNAATGPSSPRLATLLGIRQLEILALPPFEDFAALTGSRPDQTETDLELTVDWHGADDFAVATFWAPRLLREIRPARYHHRDIVRCIDLAFVSAHVAAYLAKLASLGPLVHTPISSDHIDPGSAQEQAYLFEEVERAISDGAQAWFSTRKPDLQLALDWLADNSSDPTWADQIREVQDFIIEVEAYHPERGRSTKGWESVWAMQGWIEETNRRSDAYATKLRAYIKEQRTADARKQEEDLRAQKRVYLETRALMRASRPLAVTPPPLPPPPPPSEHPSSHSLFGSRPSTPILPGTPELFWSAFRTDRDVNQTGLDQSDSGSNLFSSSPLLS